MARWFALLFVLFLLVVGLMWMQATSSSRPPAHLVELLPAGAEPELLGDGLYTKMRAVSVGIPSLWSARVNLPHGARFETYLSFARSKLDALEGASCRARVEAAGDGSPDVIFDREVRPDKQWLPLRAKLPESAERTAEIRFRLDCQGYGGPNFDRAARWSVPIVSPPPVRGAANVLLISIDTLRADHLHAYQYARLTSPNIDALAARGLLFRHAETVQSATWPALTSLHTSLYPSAHGVVWNGHSMPNGIVTLAELLRAEHFSTSAFITNMKRGRHPGFSRLYHSPGVDQAEDDERAVEAACEQLRLEKDRRFFLWLHLVSPHAGYSPPPPYDSAFALPGASPVKADIGSLIRIRRRRIRLGEADVARIVGLYDGEVAWVDELVGRILSTLRELDLESNTLVVFTADHGEDLYEHNHYFFHSPSVYRSSMQIPLIIAFPGRLPVGTVTDHAASIVDVAPTILGLLGLPQAPAYQGQNLLPGGVLPQKPVRNFAFGETNGKIYTLRNDEWRFVYNPDRLQPAARGGAYPIAQIELYDQRNDPGERMNLAESQPELVLALTAEIFEWKKRYLANPAVSEGLDPEAIDELRALGYFK